MGTIVSEGHTTCIFSAEHIDARFLRIFGTYQTTLYDIPENCNPDSKQSLFHQVHSFNRIFWLNGYNSYSPFGRSWVRISSRKGNAEKELFWFPFLSPGKWWDTDFFILPSAPTIRHYIVWATTSNIKYSTKLMNNNNNVSAFKIYSLCWNYILVPNIQEKRFFRGYVLRNSMFLKNFQIYVGIEKFCVRHGSSIEKIVTVNVIFHFCENYIYLQKGVIDQSVALLSILSE
jgi:hypothetical protein